MVRQAITDQITYYNPFNDVTDLETKDDWDFFETVIGMRLFRNDPAPINTQTWPKAKTKGSRKPPTSLDLTGNKLGHFNLIER